MHIQDKLKNFCIKIFQNSLCKRIDNNNKKTLSEKFFYNFFLWLIVYQSFIFYLKKTYNRRRYKFEKINKLTKKTNIYNKTFETFFIGITSKHKKIDKILLCFLFTTFIDVFKVRRNYLDYFKVHFLIQNKNINRYQSKIEEKKKTNFKMQNIKSLKVYRSIETQKNLLFHKDIKSINLYLKEKILKSNYMLSYNLIEQKAIIEQIYDHFYEAKNLFFKIKNKMTFNS